MARMSRSIGVIGHQSPLVGLRHRRLKFVEVLAQSTATVAPTAASVTIPAIVISLTGSGAVPVFLASTALVLMVAYCVTQFARRMVSASGVYSYTAKGLGPYAAFTSGWSSMIGYAGAAMTSALAGGLYLATLLGEVGVDWANSAWAVGGCIVVVSAAAGVLMLRGIQLSARVSLTLEIVSVGLVVTVLLLLLVASPSAPSPASDVESSFDNLTLGMLLALMSFVGFESAGTLGVEARRPFVTVPRAIIWTPLVLAVLYLFATAAQSSIFAESPLLLNSPIPIAELAQREQRTAVTLILDVGIFSSWFACLMGSTNALVRVMFSMGREQVLPRRIGRTHARYGTPYVAIGIAVPLVAGSALLVLATDVSLNQALVGFLTLSAYGYLVAYALLCVATPVFLHRLGELTPLPLVVGAVAFVSTVFLVGWTLAAQTLEDGGFALVYVLLMSLGWARLVWLARCDRARLEDIGVYDEPILADMLDVAEGEKR